MENKGQSVISAKLRRIQTELKAPKNQRNNFGKYNYRSCEDILEAVKPLLSKYECTLTVSDEIKQLGDIIFVESIAVISDGEHDVITMAQAGIEPNRKGMDIAQSFGSSSSYARKYALNGLFLIDDNKDADSTNTHDKEPVSKVNAKAKATTVAKTENKTTKHITLDIGDGNWVTVLSYIARNKSKGLEAIVNTLSTKYAISPTVKKSIKGFVDLKDTPNE
jgi:hypothetical protein